MATKHHDPERTPERRPSSGGRRDTVRRRDQAALLRLLHGELAPAEAARLRERLAAEPELAAALRRMEGSWERLDLPPAPPAPPGFAARVAARTAEEGRSGAAETAPFRPAWARAMAAGALVGGIVAGAAVGWLVIPQQPLALQTVPAVASQAGAGPGAGSGAAAGAEPGSATAAGTTAAADTTAAGTTRRRGAGTVAETTASTSGLDALTAGSVESLAESYWSAFAPDDDTAGGGGESLR